MIRTDCKMTVSSCCDKNIESSPDMGVKQSSRSDLYSGLAAFEHVRDNIDGLNGTPGVEDNDLIFLKALMESPAMRGIVKVQDRLSSAPQLPAPITTSSAALLSELLAATSITSSPAPTAPPGGAESGELRQLLAQPHLQQLIRTHDEIGKLRGKHEEKEDSAEYTDASISTPSTTPAMYTDLIRMVGLRKTLGEPLGLTVHQEDSGQLVVARILGGGPVERQGLLHPGDVILEVNGASVASPEELQQEMCRAKDTVTLKVAAAAPARAKHQGGETAAGKKLTCYMRALYDYDPAMDTLLPCREIGLPFRSGDVLQIVDQRDPNWWQARIVASSASIAHANNDSNSVPPAASQDGRVGLIPSLELEERRKAFVAPEADYVHKIGMCGTRISKKKRRFLYKSKSNNDFDKDELLLYEEVTRMPPFKRKTLVLIGSQGVGRRTLKNRLVNSDPEKFGSVIPHTSRPQRVLEEDGKSYWFCDRPAMEEEIREHRYLEYGTHNGHLYGTHLDSIRDVIRRGRMCVLDCGPGSLKTLHNSAEFLPYVVFIAAPGMELLKQMYNQPGGSRGNLQFDRQSSIRYSSRRARTLESLASLYEEDDLRNTVEESARLQRAYEKYVDLVLINEDFDVTFRRLVQALDALATEHQWVPVNWIY